MKEIKISTTNQEGEKIVGLKTIPEVKKDKHPTVILVPGFGMTKDEYKGFFIDLANLLAGQGYLVYRFDVSGRNESQGDFSKTTLTKHIGELNKIVDDKYSSVLLL